MSMNKLSKALMMAAALAASGLCSTAQADDLTQTITLRNLPGNSYLGADENTVLEIYIGPQAHINTMSWDVTLTAYQGSLLSLAYMALGDSQSNSQLFFLPALIADPDGSYHPGTGHYAGSVDFRAVDEPGWGIVDLSFSLNDDGILRLEFAENMDDLPGADALWNKVTLTFGYSVSAVPEPASAGLMLLGLGVAGAAARRRQRLTPGA